MGLGVPIYSYCLVQGGKRQRKDGKDGVHNTGSAGKLAMFFHFLSDPLVKQIAIKKRRFYSRDGQDIANIDWRGPTIRERDIDRRPQLRALLKRIDGTGVIVVPNYDQLSDGYRDAPDLLRDVCNSAIAPISVDRVQEFIQPLLRELKRHHEGAYCPDLDKRINRALIAITNRAVRDRGALENSHVRRKKGER